MKLRSIAIIISIFLVKIGYTQKTDSEYKSLLSKANAVLNEGKINESIDIYKEVIKDGHLIKNDTILSDALAPLASIYSVMGMQDSIVPLARQVLELENPSISSVIHIHTYIGEDRRNAHDDDSALYHFKKVLEFNKKKEKTDSTLFAAALTDVSSSYTNLNMGDSALFYCLEAINYVESNKNINNLTYAYTRISDVFRSLYNLNRAEEYAQKAIESAEGLTFKAPRIEANLTMANIQYLSGNPDLALHYIEIAKNVNEGRKNRLKPKIDISYLQATLTMNDNFNESEFALLAQLKEESQEQHDLNKLKIIELRAISKNMSMDSFETNIDNLWIDLDADNKLYYAKQLLAIRYEFNRKNNEWKKALECKEELAQINDKYHAAQQHYTIYELEALYKKSEQDNRIKLLDKQNEIQTIKIANKNRLLWSGGIGLGLISLLALILFKSRKTIARQKDEITISLEEKDTLLREIHHRVKNNLQVISSLLRLQSNTTDDEVAIEALKEGQSRVQSMSLIHQNLYQKENLTGINVNDYLGKLSENLFGTYDISKDRITLDIDIEEINLDVDSVVPLGLIINELITNSLKYAFPDDRSGKIDIILKEIKDKLHLTVKDDGIGISSMDEMGSANSFGFRLINSFARKLDAEVHISNENGTSVTMIISDYEMI